MHDKNNKDISQELEADIVIVGGGIAGLSAATAAAWSGKSVFLIERSGRLGGTASHANGSIWVPNNHLAKSKGIQHTTENELRFILSECWPTFSNSSDRYGVERNVYEKTKRYIEFAEKVISDLDQSGVQKFTQLEKIFNSFFYSKSESEHAAEEALKNKQLSSETRIIRQAARESWDYKWENPYNLTPYGKHIWASFDFRISAQYFWKGLRKHWWHIISNISAIKNMSSLSDQIYKLPTKLWGYGSGLILAERFRRHLKKSGVNIYLHHDCINVESEEQRVEAVILKSALTGQKIRCKVNDAAIFSSGCFSQLLTRPPYHNEQPVRSTCVASTTDGNTLQIFKGLDVKIDEAPKPLFAQSIFQLAQRGEGLSQEPVFFIFGDSFFITDRYGKRVMNEKLNYHDRASHHLNNPEREFLFLIGDRRFKERNWGFGISLPFDNSYILEGSNFTELQKKVNDLFQKENIDFSLAEDFPSTAYQTLMQFNKYAAQGFDPEYGRGTNSYDILGFPKPDLDHTSPSRTMQPLTGDKLFVCVYCLSAFTTHGGLQCDQNSKVLSKQGEPWKNLYAVGSFASSFLNGHYPAHGLQIGSGVVFGYLAGLHATCNAGRLKKLESY